MKQNLSENRSGTFRGRLAACCSLILFVALTLLCSEARAQVGSATVSGEVQDASGAVVPGATVTLHNIASGSDRELKSNSVGSFSFPAVAAGDYNLHVTRSGFESFSQNGIHLNAGDNTAIAAIHLRVGNVSDTVTVQQDVAGIPRADGQPGSTISSAEIDRLSITGRDATELEKTLPGFAMRNLGPQNP